MKTFEQPLCERRSYRKPQVHDHGTLESMTKGKDKGEPESLDPTIVWGNEPVADEVE